MVKAYSYIRMSTPEQLKGASLKRQLEASRKYAEEKGWDFDDSLRDIGISAYKGKNAQHGSLGDFIHSCEIGKIKRGSILIIENLDRLSRQKPINAFALFTTILQHGITIVTLVDGKQFTEDSLNENFGDIYVSIGSLIRAHEESEVKSDRLRDAWSRKKKNASIKKVTSRCPAWLSLAKDKNKFVINPDRQRVIKRIFQLLSNGVGKSVIAKTLNEESVETFGKSVGWHSSYIQKLSTQEAVIGTFQPYTKIDGIRVSDGDPVKNYFPAVIDKTTYYKAQKAISERRISGRGRKGKRYTNIFSGIAKCGICGGSMIYLNKGKPPKGGQYLACSGAKRALCSNHKHFPYAMFEDHILGVLAELDISNLILDDDSEIEKMENLVVVTESELKKIISMRKKIIREFGTHGDETAADVIHEMGEEESKLRETLKGQKKLLRQRKAASVDIGKIIDNVSALRKLIIKSNDGEIYEIRAMISAELRRIIKELRLYDDGLIHIDTGNPNRCYVLDKLSDKSILSNKVNMILDRFTTPETAKFNEDEVEQN